MGSGLRRSQSADPLLRGITHVWRVFLAVLRDWKGGPFLLNSNGLGASQTSEEFLCYV
jgi:hypothetical protein